MTDTRVGIDGVPLLGPKTGVGQYTACLCDALTRADPELQLRFFYGLSWSDIMPRAAESGGRKALWQTILFLISRAVRLMGPRVAIYRKRMLSRAERVIFYRGIAKHRPQVIHATNQCIYPSDIPTVITIHDISCFRHPETHPQARVQWQQRMLPDSIERAQRILAVSEFTRHELIDYFGVAPDKIVVTHNGVDPVFRPRARQDVESVLHGMGLTADGYLLAVGTLEPRKNLEILLAAQALLPNSLSARYPLVIAGMRGWKESTLVRLLEPLVARGVVRVLGYVPQAMLPVLYSGARAFAYPSIYEGFGLPPLEAMASGVPVAVSNVSSLPEVVGDAGLLVPPHDVDAWAQALQKMLLDDAFRRLAISRGLARAKEFTWDRCAAATLQVYREVSGSVKSKTGP